MSDYEEDFENYDDDDFEDDGGDDYDVIPQAKPSGKGGRVATPETPVTPQDVMSPARGLPQRSSYAGGQRPASGQPQAGLLGKASTVQVPLFAGLNDAQRRAAAKKLAAGLKKMQLVTLSTVEMEDFPVLQSLSLYELANMGRSKYADCKVAATQTGDDNKEEEIQTEDIFTREYTCQVPEDRNVVFAGEHLASSLGKDTGSANQAVMRITQIAPDQENRLLAFMRWAGPIVLAAMGMNPIQKKLAIQPTGGQGLSGGSMRLHYEALLSQRPITGISYCQGNNPLLLASYAPVGAQLGAAALLQDHSLNSKGLLVVWDLSVPSQPSAVLLSEGSPMACCWAPAPSTSLVFAGMEEGGVCAWDLEEPEGRHPLEELADGSHVTTRRPSYSTEYLADVATTAAPVVGIATIPSNDSRSRPCQVISLNGWGTVSVYTATLLPANDRNAADMDLGLRPGSRLKLVRTAQLARLGAATLRPSPPKPVPTIDQVVQAFSLLVLPGQNRQFVVGSDCGKVLRGSWVGVPPAPKEYVSDDFKSRQANNPSSQSVPTSTTTLHGSPFVPGLFLAGHDDGSIALHTVNASPAIAVWPEVSPAKIMVVRWSPTRPAVFFALDALCTLYTFDLTQLRSGPVVAQSCMVQASGNQVASIPSFFEAALTFTGEGALSKRGGGAEGEAPPPKGIASYCIGYDDGQLEVNLFAERYSNASAAAADLAALRELGGDDAARTANKGGAQGGGKDTA